jgi:hypothetical protein
MTLPPIHIVTPVWGAAYTRCFLEIGLASLLSPGNIGSLDRNHGHLMHVFTTPEDRDVIMNSGMWRRLQSLIDCRVELLGPDQMRLDEPHLTMSNCHRSAIAHADASGAAMMFYNPDIVIADGGMQALARLLMQGKRAIQVVGLRLVKDDVVPLLQARHMPDDTSVVISPRELMAIAMKHLHPITLMHMFEASGTDLMPQEVLWPVGEEGIVARCFHIHPVLVYPRVRNAPFTTTVDDDYLRAACPEAADEYVVADSDEFCLCELSSVSRGLTGLPRNETAMDIAGWAFAYARPHHFEHFCRRILLHSGLTRESDWQAACAKSDQAVSRIFEYMLEHQAGRSASRR